MTTIKVCLTGPEGSGKTVLVQKIVQGDKFQFNPSHESTMGATFRRLVIKSESNTDGDGADIWDISGNQRYDSLKAMYYEGTDIFLYCVDMSTAPLNQEQLEKDIKEMQKQYPNSQIIVVGTKSDVPSKYLEKNTTIFNNLVIESKNVKKMITSKDDPKISENLQQEFIKIAEEKKTHQQPPSNLQSAFDTSVFPASYKKIWNKVFENPKNRALGANIDLRNYHCAVELLKDYCKTDTPKSKLSSGLGSIKLFFTFHLGRNHTSTVRKVLSEPDKSNLNVEQLLEKLKVALGNSKLEPDGSLARRIRFIQGMTGTNVINTDNREISPNMGL
ncbi:GTP-binding protein [Legionella sp. CNM-1927-20]|uniref:GTP-binding protein n=1 Tax=Legionella sp. CNM-1927-20 TaxID=3422221 RepID=UPI00403B2ACD